MTRIALRTACFLLFLLPSLVIAQTPDPSPAPQSIDPTHLRFFLLTIGPGDEVWEQFGHNAIEIVDPSRNLDRACNWGVFDFNNGFYKRFILGRMIYSMDDVDGPATIDYYKQSNRSIFRQELNLSPSQKISLYNFIAWNELPENCNYRYDYYKNNCSTCTRDAIDRSINGAIAATLKSQPTNLTFRWHTNRIVSSNLPLYTCLLFILGQPVDRPISAWEESFLPLRLMDHLRHVTILNDAGQSVPLIKSEEILFTATRPPQRTTPPRWLLPFLLLGLLCASLFAILTHYFPTSKPARITFILLSTLWFFFIGSAGTFALWGSLFTEHSAIYRNENILHFFPPAILLTLLIPLAARRWRRCAAAAKWIAIATAATSLLALCLKILPSFHQSNYELIAWVLPTHLAAAYGLWTLTAQPSPTPSPGRPARAPSPL